MASVLKQTVSVPLTIVCEHTHDQGTVKTEATCTDKGQRSRSCSLCGAKEVLDTPKLSSVSNTLKGVKVKWKEVIGAEKYRVYRKSGDSGWKRIAETASTSYTDTKVKVVLLIYTQFDVSAVKETMPAVMIKGVKVFSIWQLPGFQVSLISLLALQ